MPRSCSLCQHPKRVEIDLALTAHSESTRRIAKRFGLSQSACLRHLHGCLPTLHEMMRNALGNAETKTVLEQMASLHARTLQLLTEAEEAGERGIALRAISEARHNLRLLGELDGSLHQQGPAGGTLQVQVIYQDRLESQPELKTIETTREPETIEAHNENTNEQ